MPLAKSGRPIDFGFCSALLNADFFSGLLGQRGDDVGQAQALTDRDRGGDDVGGVDEDLQRLLRRHLGLHGVEADLDPGRLRIRGAALMNASTLWVTPSALRLRPIWAIESPSCTSKVTGVPGVPAA